MNNPSNNQFNENYLGELLLLAFEGKCSKEEFDILQDQIIHNPKARDYYYEFLTTYMAFTPYGSAGIAALWSDVKDEDVLNLLQSLASDEDEAPTIEIPEEKPEKIIEVAAPPKAKKDNKIYLFSLYFSVISSAAMLLFIITLQFMPEKGGREVATLTDSMNAKWSDSDSTMKNGVRLRTSNPPLKLREGFVELVFDNQTCVTIEAPAEFEILTNNQIQLSYGRLYARVPEQAYGFTVSTEFSKIIDLGTEFGVQQDMSEMTEVHVIKGKTNLVSWDSGNKANVEINAGLAKRIRHSDGVVQDVPCKTELFVRQIDSARNFLWKGQGYLDLADIVGGGNGFTGGKKNYGIDIKTGAYRYFNETIEIQDCDTKYVVVKNNRYIDGVFVPDGKFGPEVVASTGLEYNDFPATSGYTWGGVFDGAFHMSPNVTKHTFMIDGREYGYRAGDSAICMHSNKGVTFDLKAIRNDIFGLTIKQFSAKVAISETNKPYCPNGDENNIELYVLIDGQRAFYSGRINSSSGKVDIKVPLNADDRFLTLAVLDGDDGLGYDWSFLLEPRLEFVKTQ